MYGDKDRIIVTELLASGSCAVLRVTGELDLRTETDLLDQAGRRLADGRRYLVLDLTALAFCDSRGLNCLLSLNWLCGHMEGRLLLSGVGTQVMRALTVSGAGKVLRCFPSVGHALADVPGAERPPWPPPPPLPQS
ncbi:STAS domain-containing protein [Streptomyces sp. NPDC002992]|uniref:STAS domain-containing protein n=1 Tax=Streptomyces sp. NPDC002992 TaxID=3154273 RepID=UPI00339EC5D6